MVEEGLTGYLSPVYADAFDGHPLYLPRSRSWVLRRSIPGTTYQDAMGLYPIMCCGDWDRLEEDVECLYDCVSLVFVPDPFVELGNTTWLDLYTPYKLHHIVDYSQDWKPSKHHRYYARKAECKVEMALDPDFGTWCELYSNLVERHQITGVQAFSPESFEKQLQVPGLVAFQAYDKTGVVGMHLWYAQGDVAYSHLAACSERGYEKLASYALMSTALEFFAGNVEFLDLGGSADAGEGGLDFFKRGWANGTRQAYLCGKILNLSVYKELVNGDERRYFPAYRG